MSSRAHIRCAAADLGRILSGSAVVLSPGGTSMFPAIREGDRIEVIPFDPEGSQIGDILLTARRGRLLCHRLRRRIRRGGERLLVTRGDSLRGDDPPVAHTEVLGRVRVIERGDRRIFLDRGLPRLYGRFLGLFGPLLAPFGPLVLAWSRRVLTRTGSLV